MSNESRPHRPTVLAIDDTPSNIDVVKGVLSEQYRVLAAINGPMGLKVVDKHAPDIILLDIMMPEMSGYEVCRRLKADQFTADIPIIFLTARDEEKDETEGLELGAVDYITKPIRPAILRARVRNHLELKRARDQLQRQNEILEDKVLERTRQLAELEDVAMVAMGALAEARDPETGNHIRRTQHYVRALANRLRRQPAYAPLLTPQNITMLFKSAPLHDVGKVGVPDRILLKSGKLTADEFEEMKKHVDYGRDALMAAADGLAINSNFLRFAIEITATHHEKWDGSGYPNGLAGNDIPLSGRLMAVADVYDALISKRVYKPPFPHEEAVSIIGEGRGSHFDPAVVDVFLEIQDEFQQIAFTYRDRGVRLPPDTDA